MNTRACGRAAAVVESIESVLGNVPGGRRLVPQLQEAMRHRDSAVQFAAADCCGGLTGRSMSESYRRHFVSRPAGPIGEQGFDLLGEKIYWCDPDDEVRLAAEAIVRDGFAGECSRVAGVVGRQKRWVKQAAGSRIAGDHQSPVKLFNAVRAKLVAEFTSLFHPSVPGISCV